jgi:hypothetical protein
MIDDYKKKKSKTSCKVHAAQTPAYIAKGQNRQGSNAFYIKHITMW